MANNRIQIKRSTANATVTGLSNGELAFTQAGNILYIGAPDGSGSLRIGGLQAPGTLTANQALVANSTSGIDQIRVGNLQFSGTTQNILANNTLGNPGDVLFSGGSSSNLYWASAGTVGVNTAAQYTWSNVHTFQNTVNFLSIVNVATGAVIANSTGIFATGTVNAASHTVGSSFVANSSGAFTTGTVNAASHTVGANLVINTTSISYVGNTTTSPTIAISNTGSLAIGNSTTTQTTAIITVANSVGSANITPAGFFGNGINITSINATSITNGTLPDARLSSAVVNTSGSFTLAGNNTFGGTNTVFTSNVSFSGANVNIGGTNTNITANSNIGGTNTNISANVTLTGATLTGTSTDLSMRNGVFSGNLTVSGTVITVNTSQMVVNDNIIQLGAGNTSADLVDSGFFSPAGNATAIWYSGIARIAASSNSTLPLFRVFVSNTNPNTSATIDTSANTRTGIIQSYLAPYGLTGIFVVNATNISISGNSSIPFALAANTLSLSTALPGTSGGTGLQSIANNSLIFGNSTNGFNTLALNTTGGYVLQSNGTAIVYDFLDGGTF